jgi:hypothetical protein
MSSWSTIRHNWQIFTGLIPPIDWHFKCLSQNNAPIICLQNDYYDLLSENVPTKSGSKNRLLTQIVNNYKLHVFYVKTGCSRVQNASQQIGWGRSLQRNSRQSTNNIDCFSKGEKVVCQKILFRMANAIFVFRWVAHKSAIRAVIKSAPTNQSRFWVEFARWALNFR